MLIIYSLIKFWLITSIPKCFRGPLTLENTTEGLQLICPTWFSSTFLMAYSKAELKSNGNKASPCHRPFWIGNLLDRFLPIWILWQVSFILVHILTSLTSFVDTQIYKNIVRYFPPNWIIGFLEIWIAIVLSHCTPIFTLGFDENLISSWSIMIPSSLDYIWTLTERYFQ
jgi:hypothetical protein